MTESDGSVSDTDKLLSVYSLRIGRDDLQNTKA